MDLQIRMAVAQYGPRPPRTAVVLCRRKLAGIQRSLRKYTISRNRRNLQNRNSAAAEIAIRFGPKILLKCSVRKTGPKYPTISLDDGYKSSFSLNHKLNHYDRRIDRRTHPHADSEICNHHYTVPANEQGPAVSAAGRSQPAAAAAAGCAQRGESPL